MRYNICMYHSVLLPPAGTYLTLKPNWDVPRERPNEKKLLPVHTHREGLFSYKSFVTSYRHPVLVTIH